jgi:1,4-alpha-glucan branching enzyme
MFTYPGKKLLFMGCEFAQSSAWDFDSTLNWHELEYPHHHGIKTLVKDLNHLYKTLPAFYQHDFEVKGFKWINHRDAEHSILSYMRHHNEQTLIIVLNFSPMPQVNYRVGVSTPGTYYVILNSDSKFYDGSNIGDSYLCSEPTPHNGLEHSICLTAPPLAGLILKL